MSKGNWYLQPIETVLAELGSSESGLSVTEAATRLTANGPNALNVTRRIRPLRILLGQFRSPIVWILFGASGISWWFHEVLDAISILTILLLNAAMGFSQELSAAKSIAALKQLTAPQTRVLRGGSLLMIPAKEVVVGDLIILEAGDLVAADARLVSVASLACNESALTGESESVEKETAALPDLDTALADRINLVFQGTSVAAGTGQAVVVATAMATELGRIVGLIQELEAEPTTPLQRKLDAFASTLIWVALGIVGLHFGLGFLRGTKLIELTMTSVSLAVAAVPEGLPAVVTVALSLGVVRMARRNALIRQLTAVETLGSTSVICTDKTGTLTRGEMSVRTLFVAGQSYDATGAMTKTEGLQELALTLLASQRGVLTHDPTEVALRQAGIWAGENPEGIEQMLPTVQELPFDSDRKRSSVVRRRSDGTLRAFVTGAPDALLPCCTHLYTPEGIRPLTDTDRADVLAQTATMAKQALRVLGSASRDLAASPQELTVEDVEQGLVFVGLTGMLDPPRPEAHEAIVRCSAAGIRVVMITGDHPNTAVAIARELGITSGTDVVTGVALDAMSKEELERRAPEIAVYARVTAEHKLRIVRALKAGDAVVAMTGDGVNDAPAIKGADIGIAMGKSGTEVTKQAASMVITDDNFATIVAAIEEGRGTYDNIRKTLEYLLAGNTGELLVMTACVVVGLPSPLLPIHLLWINLVTDGLPALCLATDPIDSDVMKRFPRKRSERITTPRFLKNMFLNGFLTAGIVFAEYLYVLRTDTVDVARTHAFAVLVIAELLRSFGARSETKPVWRISLWSNRNLVLVVVASLGFLVWSQYNTVLGRFLKVSPVSLLDCLHLLILGTLPLVILEILKVVRNAKRHR